MPKYTSYESALADVPHESVVDVVEARLCPLVGEIREKDPGALQVV